MAKTMVDLDTLAHREAVLLSGADRDTLIVTGPDRRSWLEGLITCELKNLAPGAGTWGLVLTRQGKVQSVVWVVASAEALHLALSPGTGPAMAAELGRMLIMEDAELAPPAEPQTWFSLHGPEAAARAARWAERAGGVSAAIDFTGLGGAALVVPRAREGVVLEGNAGSLLDESAWARLRLERGLPEFGVDFDAGDRPHEAALDRRAVSWSKGCYLGQEVVCMQDMRGKVKRSVRVLEVDAPREANIPMGAHVVAGEPAKPLGTVTSRAYSERAGAWRVMAKVLLDGLDAARLDTPEGSYPARVADLV
jgi:folate-binding protein YgfZ